MVCEKCKNQMVHQCENSVQGWSCPICGWSILTTYIDEIYQDTTEYSVFIKNETCIDIEKIRLVSKIAGVNFIAAKQMLAKGDVCILKATAVEIKKVINELQIAQIPFEVTPSFRYK